MSSSGIEEMFVQGDSERFEAEGRVESLASDTWTKDKETVREGMHACSCT